MRSKLALILALGAILALAVVGSAPAASRLGSVTETLGLTGSNGSSAGSAPTGSSTSPLIPPATSTTPSTTTTTPAAPQCSDGIDNDGDGLIDLEDPDCSSPGDNTEASEATPS